VITCRALTQWRADYCAQRDAALQAQRNAASQMEATGGGTTDVASGADTEEVVLSPEQQHLEVRSSKMVSLLQPELHNKYATSDS
jgi:hypothetical protein